MSPTKTDEPRSERITVAVSPSLLKTLEAYAEAHGQSISAAVGDVLEDAGRLLTQLTKLRQHSNERKRRLWAAKSSKGTT